MSLHLLIIAHKGVSLNYLIGQPTNFNFLHLVLHFINTADVIHSHRIANTSPIFGILPK